MSTHGLASCTVCGAIVDYDHELMLIRLQPQRRSQCYWNDTTNEYACSAACVYAKCTIETR